MTTLLMLSIALATIITTETTSFLKVSLTSVRQLNYKDSLKVKSILECASTCSHSSNCEILAKDNGNCYFINSSTTERIGAIEVSSLHIDTQLIDKCTSQGYKTFLKDGLCFKEYNTISDWSTANTTCEQDGGRLILMRKWEMDMKILRLKSMNLTVRKYFIGGNDLDIEGKWEWNDGSPLSSTDSWVAGEPDSKKGNGNEDCLALLYTSVGFLDASCQKPKAFICEMELF